MVVLRINNTDLPTGWTHDATDWQVSTSENFSSILVSSMNDSENLTAIVFNNNLELGVKYYGRARMLLNTGFTEWSNIDVFTPKDIDEVALLMDIPSIITTPTLRSNFDLNSHPSKFFTITIDNGFNTLGNATHESTSWIIEDDTGKPIWASFDDKENLLSLTSNVNLELNKVYRIHASIKGTNGDSSQYGTITFYTSDSKDFLLTRYLYRNDLTVDLDIEHPYIVGLDYLEYEIYKDEEIVYNNSIIDNFFTIDKTYLSNDKIDILKVRTEVNGKFGDWSYIYIIPVNTDGKINTGNNIPYLYGTENDGFVSFPLRFPYKF